MLSYRDRRKQTTECLNIGKPALRLAIFDWLSVAIVDYLYKFWTPSLTDEAKVSSTKALTLRLSTRLNHKGEAAMVGSTKNSSIDPTLKRMHYDDRWLSGSVNAWTGQAKRKLSRHQNLLEYNCKQGCYCLFLSLRGLLSIILFIIECG